MYPRPVVEAFDGVVLCLKGGNDINVGEISGSYGGEYEDGWLSSGL
jgi:hypothetical protein